jgi:hypothetical protein
MRVLAICLVLASSAPALAAHAGSAGQPSTQKSRQNANPDSQCPRTTSYLADQIGSYRGQPLTPKKLTELPPATTYMAVFRHVGPCEAPLTMSDYRNPRRR